MYDLCYGYARYARRGGKQGVDVRSFRRRFDGFALNRMVVPVAGAGSTWHGQCDGSEIFRIFGVPDKASKTTPRAGCCCAKGRQYRCLIEPWRTNPAEIGSVTAPRVVQWVVCQSRANRVEMQVTHKCQQVARFVDRDGVIAPLKHVAEPARLTIEGAGVGRQYPLHRPAQRQRTGPQRQVEMVWHKAVGEYRKIGIGPDGAENTEESPVVRGLVKNRLASVPARENMIDDAIVEYPGRPDHACIIT